MRGKGFLKDRLEPHLIEQEAFRVQRSEKIKKVAQNAERGTQNAMLSAGEEWHQKDESFLRKGED